MNLNITKGKREQVFEILDKQGYILDDQTCKIFGESGLYRVHEHVRIWKRLKKDRDFFSQVQISEKKKAHRCHLVRIATMPEGQYYKVGKEFYNSIHLSPDEISKEA